MSKQCTWDHVLAWLARGELLVIRVGNCGLAYHAASLCLTAPSQVLYLCFTSDKVVETWTKIIEYHGYNECMCAICKSTLDGANLKRYVRHVTLHF